MNTKKLLYNQIKTYPKLLPIDVFKFLYQSAFGCEHMVSSLEEAIVYIKKEAKEKASPHISPPLTEKLDGDFSRVPLSYMEHGLSAETLGKLFFLSAKESEKDVKILEQKLNEASKLVGEGAFGFCEEDFFNALQNWKKSGYSSLHHSENYRKEYNPSYRVVSNKYVPFLPLFCLIDKKLYKEKIILSIEGGSSSGKTTLSHILTEIYGCTVFHMDDFFLQPHQRTEKRLSEIGGNLDRERFFSEIIIPLTENKTVKYRKFDCSSMELLLEISVNPSRFTVVEGVYSMHPYFSDYFNISVFLDIDPQTQKERIEKRNSPALQKRFFSEWIPMENQYFEKLNIKDRCDLTIKIF